MSAWPSPVARANVLYSFWQISKEATVPASLPRNITDTVFLLRGSLFQVVEARYFARATISAQHRQYLSTLPSGTLVSVSFFGYPVPLVVVRGGVAKLKKINKGGQHITGAGAISTALGIRATRRPVALVRAQSCP